MVNWRKDAHKEPIIIDIDSLVPADHLLQKVEKVMDYEWLYKRLDPYYCHDTVSYAFCKRFPDGLTTEIFEHILNKAQNNRMVDPSTIFIDGTHIKARSIMFNL